MASIYVGANRGVIDLGPDALTEGASTGSTDFEFRVDTGKGSTRKEIVLFLEAVARYFEDGRVNTFTL